MTRGKTLIFRLTAVFIFIFSLPNFTLADRIKGLIEKNFGERFYGVYYGEVKLGYLIHEISQTDEAVIQDFSMNMRMTLSEEDERKHKAKYAFSQIVSRYRFSKDTGLLSEMTEADGKKYYADFSSLLSNNHFKQELSTLTAQYKGNFSYEVLISDKDGETSKLLKLPNLHIYDYFAEINFILSNPQVGETRAIDVFDLDFENEVFMGATLTVKQKVKGLDGKYEYIIQEDLDEETFTYTVDHFGNIIGAEMFGLTLIKEPKEQALTLDAKNI